MGGGGSYDGGLNAMPTVKSLAATSANSGQTIGPMLSHSTKQIINQQANQYDGANANKGMSPINSNHHSKSQTNFANQQ